MAERKSYAILGLGIFGSTIARVLSKSNHDVIAIDKDISCVDRVSEFVVNAVQADITDLDQLRSIGVQDVDCAVVATGSHLEDSIMAVLNLKELGVPYVDAKAKNRKYLTILEKVGADRVVRPEKEMGERVAKQLLSSNIIDLIDIDNEYSVIEIAAPKNFQGKTLKELDLRQNYGINVLGIRKQPNAPLTISPDADYKIEEKDCLLIIADKEKFNSLHLE